MGQNVVFLGFLGLRSQVHILFCLIGNIYAQWNSEQLMRLLKNSDRRECDVMMYASILLYIRGTIVNVPVPNSYTSLSHILLFKYIPPFLSPDISPHIICRFSSIQSSFGSPHRSFQPSYLLFFFFFVSVIKKLFH